LPFCSFSQKNSIMKIFNPFALVINLLSSLLLLGGLSWGAIACFKLGWYARNSPASPMIEWVLGDEEPPKKAEKPGWKLPLPRF
jgi:hypothetical protein